MAKIEISKEDYEFLKELQHELNTQPNDGSADPVYWGVMDYDYELTAEGHGGGMLYDWWEINQVKNVSKEKHGVTHPCQMPVEVMQRVIGIIDPEYTIVDPFMGSGTTAIACIKERRHFVGFELNKEYFDTAVRRIKAEQSQLTLF